MSDVEEIKTVLKHTLDSRGVTRQLKSRIRAEVHSALDDRSQQPKPKLNDENFLINELIREYLQYNKYHYTNSVLSAETGHPKEQLSKEFLSQEFNVSCEQQIPLLYKIVSKCKKESMPSKKETVSK